MNPLKHMSIAVKGLLIVALALIPIGYLMFELVKEKNTAIDFSQNEIAGAHILDDHLRNILVLAVEGRFFDLHKDSQPYAKLEAAMGSFNAALANSPYLSAATMKAFNEAKDIETRIDRLIDVVSEISDKSNLTLDPDVDSYYTMDAITTKMPALMNEMSDIHKIMTDVIWAGSMNAEQRAVLNGKHALALSVLTAVDADDDKGYAGNSDGTLKPAIEKLYAVSENSAHAMFMLLETMLASDGKNVSLENLDTAYGAFIKANDALMDKGMKELVRMLQKRIDRFKADEYASYGVTGVLVLATVCLLLVLMRSISAPIKQLVASMEKLTNRETGIAVPGTDRKDEVGTMARATEALRLRVAGAFSFADNVESSVTSAVADIAGSSRQIQASANGLNKLADETKQLSNAVAAASTQAAQTSSQVAASAEELTASISEISGKVQQSSRVAMEASNKGESINEAMKGLAEKSGRVSEVINVITKIAEQINLLALNATIEAARAGEAGKGFAVVASEVKALSNQTAKAADEITQQIAEMQGATTLAVESVVEIMGIINEISAHVTAVAAAVEEQSAATNEIARNISQTATGTQEISQNIVSVENGAEETGKTSKEMLDAIDGMNMQIMSLRDSVAGFLKEMRKA